MIERHFVVERLEMLLRDVDGFEHTLADRDARHDDDEFLEPINFVQFKNGAQIDVGLARSGLHLNGKFAPLKRRYFFDVVLFLNRADIFEDVIVNKRETVSHAKLSLEKPANLQGLKSCRRRLHERLPVEHVDDGVDRVLLILECRIEFELHSATSKFIASWPRNSFNLLATSSLRLAKNAS